MVQRRSRWTAAHFDVEHESDHRHVLPLLRHVRRLQRRRHRAALDLLHHAARLLDALDALRDHGGHARLLVAVPRHCRLAHHLCLRRAPQPVADAVRGLLDGHIVLDRELAHLGHFPAISILNSSSRLIMEIADQDHIDAQSKLRELIALYENSRDLINIGAYQQGSNAKLDEAISKYEQIEIFLKQHINENIPFAETVQTMKEIV